jgi:hypothetical protein
MQENKQVTASGEVIDKKPTYPTEFINLPSKGKVYPKSSPLSSGKVEMKYVTAKEEDILTNVNYIRQGIVIDKFLQSVIVSPIDYNDLTIGDKNALLIASRILGYGKDYSVDFQCKACGEMSEGKIDLTTIDEKPLKEDLFNNINSFEYVLPLSKVKLNFKVLTHADEQLIDQELKGLKKVNPNGSYDITTRLKYTITAINGNGESGVIRNFIDNEFLARDSKAFREYVNSISPDIELKSEVVCRHCGEVQDIEVPITQEFFWPRA